MSGYDAGSGLPVAKEEVSGDADSDAAARKTKVTDIIPGQLDRNGRKIDAILESGRSYAVYTHSHGQISVHFSDEPEAFAKQRAGYLKISASLARINTKRKRIAKLRSFRETAKKRDSANVGDDIVARAIAMALGGDAEGAQDILTEVDTYLGKLIFLRGQMIYQLACLVAVGVVAVVLLIAMGPGDVDAKNVLVLKIALFGALGGFVSVASGAASMKVDTESNWVMYGFHGTTRILISVIGSVVIYYGLLAGLVPVGSPGGDSIATLYVVAFASGFSEKLIPNTMGKIEAQAAKT